MLSSTNPQIHTNLNDFITNHPIVATKALRNSNERITIQVAAKHSLIHLFGVQNTILC